MSLRGTFFVATLLLSGPLALRADTVYYPNFTSTANLTLVGNTTTATTGDGTVLRVVPAMDGQAGAAYSTTPVTLGSGNSFSTQFQFRFTNPGGIDPADGITFVLSAGSSGLGGAGGGIGYGGVGNSVAVEFDTYDNGSGAGDPNDNHVGIDTDGNLYSVTTATPYGQGSCDTRGGYIADCMSNGDIWTALITYDGTNLTLALTDGNGVTQNLLNYSIDVGSYLGTDTAYVGFTGATGSGFENEDILNWEFSNTSTLPPPPSSTPEPGSLVLLGSGLSGVAALMRRRKRRN